MLTRVSTINATLIAATIILTTLCLLSVAIDAVEVTCANDYKAFEENVLKITGYMYDPQYLYPTDEASFKRYCKNIKDGEHYAKAYSTKCLTGSSRTIASVFAYTTSRSNRKYCARHGATKGRREMSDFAFCVNKHQPSTRKCFESFLDRLNLTNTIPEAKKRLPYICCLASFLRTCLSNTLDGRLPECTPKVVESYGHFADQTFSNVMNAVCDGNEENSDRCTKILKTPKVKPTRVKHRTPFPIVFEIFEHL